MNGVLNYEGSGSKPLLAVQITELVDGIFIGCTMNHSVVDGSSFWHFFNMQYSRNVGLDLWAWEMNKMVALHTEEKLRSFLEFWVQEPKLLTEDNMAANALVTSSSPRFNVYGNDFGWGRPVGVRNGAGNKSHGKITVFAGVEEGSIDIEACLLAETLEAMANDSEFMDVVTV
ncbi:hypothetical protein CerSpe_251140 [Prunus speciosa]